jgi:hypothetical protein
MENAIKEVKESINFHKLSVKRLGIGMWLIVVLALLAHILIVAMMDFEINRLTALITFAVDQGVGDLPKDPSTLAFAGRDNNMGYLVLAMFAAVLVAIFGKMRFHLKELSTNEQRLFNLTSIQAASNAEINAEVRRALLSCTGSVSQGNDPIINLSSEAVSKISDSVLSRVEAIIKGKGS